MMMQIEAGKYYKIRQGDVIGPIRTNASDKYPYQYDGLTFFASGRHSGEGAYECLDIIEEVPAPTEYGPEIAVNGRPKWLADDDMCMAKSSIGKDWYGEVGLPGGIWAWGVIEAIRLPADHWANAVIERGYEPWAGGDTAPDDWDGNYILSRDGWEITHEHINVGWTHTGGRDDIIGYCKKAVDKFNDKNFIKMRYGSEVPYTGDPREAEIAALKQENADLIHDNERLMTSLNLAEATIAGHIKKHPDLAPIDPYLKRAREILADAWLNSGASIAADNARNGKYDCYTEMKTIIRALREGMGE